MINYILFFIGIIIVVISLILFRKDTVSETNVDSKITKIKENDLLQNIELAEEIVKELKDISEGSIKKLDLKTKEIYHLIEMLDKKMEEYEKNIAKKDDNKIQERILSHQNYIEDLKKEDNDIRSQEDTREVLQLLHEGYSISQIAKKLNKGIGEIQLICNLNKR